MLLASLGTFIFLKLVIFKLETLNKTRSNISDSSEREIDISVFKIQPSKYIRLRVFIVSYLLNFSSVANAVNIYLL